MSQISTNPTTDQRNFLIAVLHTLAQIGETLKWIETKSSNNINRIMITDNTIIEGDFLLSTFVNIIFS